MWRLVYPDDSVVEQVDGLCESVRGAKHGACALLLIVKETGTQHVGIRLDPERDFPVVYSRRGISIHMGSGAQEITTDAVVFGRMHETDDGRLDGTLWLLRKDGSVVSCPERYIDARAIESLVREPPVVI